MKKLIIAGLGLVALAALVAAGWYYRPWSPYSPSRIAALGDPEDYPQTFQTMDGLLPASPIRAHSDAAPLPRAIEDRALSYEWEGASRTLDDWMDESRTTGLIVMRDGVIVEEIYRLGADADTRHTSWSVAKSFVATLIAMAMHDGRIQSLDQSAEMFAPQYGGSDYGDTTLRHLLMMSAGMDFNEIYSEDEESDVRPFFFNAFIMRRDVDEMATEIERDRAPGEDLEYQSPNSHVLSAVARGVFRAPLAQIVEDEIWGPLGMSRDASWLQNRPGENSVAIGYCCLQASLEDYARFGQFYLQDGVWNGERLVPEGWVEQATRPNADFQEPNATYSLRGYGLHFWIPENSQGEYFMAGVYGQYVWVDTERNIVIARTAGDADWGARTAESFEVFRGLAALYGDVAAAPAESGEVETPAEATGEEESGDE